MAVTIISNGIADNSHGHNFEIGDLLNDIKKASKIPYGEHLGHGCRIWLCGGYTAVSLLTILPALVEYYGFNITDYTVSQGSVIAMSDTVPARPVQEWTAPGWNLPARREPVWAMFQGGKVAQVYLTRSGTWRYEDKSIKHSRVAPVLAWTNTMPCTCSKPSKPCQSSNPANTSKN